MKRYRILSDGDRYRVQRHVRWGPVNYWQAERYYEVRESYPKVISHWVEFDSQEEAQSYIKERMSEEKPVKRWGLFAVPKGWRVVEKFSDSKDKSGRDDPKAESS